MPPPVRIDRPELAERIARALDAGAVLVVAGAGFGKTTAIEDALRLRGQPAAWLSCSERDRDPGRLLVALLSALRRASPGTVDVLLERLAAGERVDVLGAERWLLAELETLLLEPVTLVVDDGERLAGAQASLDVLAALLHRPIDALRVVVASRRPLGLGLAKARAAGRLTELGEADLAFTPQECAALLQAQQGREPAADEVDERMAATLGWPLGLALGARSEAELSHYLDEEVLGPLDPAVRRAVLDAAAVDAVTPAIAAALGLPPNYAQRALAAGLPLTPAAGSPQALSYHPLVREHLRARLQVERSEAERAELLGRAAVPLAREGRTLEAVEAFLGAGRWAEALTTVLHDLPSALVTSPDTVRAWLERLPPAAREEPVARLLAGRLAYATGDHEAAAAALRGTVGELRDRGEHEAEWSTRLVLAESLYWLGELDELAAVAPGWDGVDGAVRGGLAQAVALWASQGLAGQGHVERSRRLVELVLRRSPADDDLAALASFHEFFVAAPAGDSDRCLQELRRVRAKGRRGPHFLRHELILSLAAFLLADQGRPREALEATGWIVTDAEALTARPFVQPLTRVLRAWLAVLAGDVAVAEQELAVVPADAPGRWPPSVGLCARAWIALDRGATAEAASLAERSIAVARTAPVPFQAIFTLAAAPALAAAGRPEAAADALRAVQARVDRALPGRRGGYHRARLRAQQAWLLHQGGDLDAASTMLQAALDDAGGAGPHLLRAEWVRVGRLAWEALERGALEPAAVLEPLEAAVPGAQELLPFAEHPSAAVRAHVAPALAASGHPDASVRLGRLAHDPDAHVAAAAAGAVSRARREPPPRVFRLLGGFVMQRGDWPVDERSWGRPMAQRLVRFMLVHRGEVVPEEVLLEAFWPGKPARSARSSLQVAVSRARAVLDAPGAERSALELVERTYRLRLDDRDRVDVDAFERAAADALAERGPMRRALLEHAVSWWGGEPLPEDRYADWTRTWRERLVRRHLQVLHALLELHLDAGDPAAAVDVAWRSLELEPLDERVHRLLMTAYARAGHRGHALRQFLECRRALVDELGVEPDAQTVELQRRILAGEPV